MGKLSAVIEAASLAEDPGYRCPPVLVKIGALCMFRNNTNDEGILQAFAPVPAPF